MKKSFLLLTLALSAATAQAQWVRQSVPFSKPTLFPGIPHPVDASTAWAAGLDPTRVFTPNSFGAGEIARTTTGGTTWQVAAVPGLAPDESISCVSAQSADMAWLTTTSESRSQVLRTTNGGQSWQALLTLTTLREGQDLTYVHFFDQDHGLALGNAGDTDRLVVYITADGGATWAPNPSVPPVADAFESLQPGQYPAVIGAHVWVPTTASRVFHSPDRGLTWTVTEIVPGGSPSPSGPRGLAFQDEMRGLALFARNDGFTDDAPLYRTTDGGATWQKAAFTGPLHGASLAHLPGTRTYVSVGFTLPVPGVDPDAGSSYSTDDGATWTALESTENHLTVAAAGPQAIWTAAYDFGTLRSTGVLKLTSTALPTRTPVDAALRAGLQVFPQPSPDGRVQVQLPAARAGLRLRVLNGLGQVVREQPVAATRFALDLSGQPAGLYVLELRSAAGVAQTKLLVR